MRSISINLSCLFSNYLKMEPIFLVHGGAGDIRDSRVPDKIKGVKTAAKAGYKILKNGGSALDAVEEAIRIMEDDESMNAGISFSYFNVFGLKYSFQVEVPY